MSESKSNIELVAEISSGLTALIKKYQTLLSKDDNISQYGEIMAKITQGINLLKASIADINLILPNEEDQKRINTNITKTNGIINNLLTY